MREFTRRLSEIVSFPISVQRERCPYHHDQPPGRLWPWCLSRGAARDAPSWRGARWRPRTPCPRPCPRPPRTPPSQEPQLRSRHRARRGARRGEWPGAAPGTWGGRRGLGPGAAAAPTRAWRCGTRPPRPWPCREEAAAALRFPNEANLAVPRAHHGRGLGRVPDARTSVPALPRHRGLGRVRDPTGTLAKVPQTAEAEEAVAVVAAATVLRHRRSPSTGRAAPLATAAVRP